MQGKSIRPRRRVRGASIFVFVTLLITAVFATPDQPAAGELASLEQQGVERTRAMAEPMARLNQAGAVQSAQSASNTAPDTLTIKPQGVSNKVPRKRWVRGCARLHNLTKRRCAWIYNKRPRRANKMIYFSRSNTREWARQSPASAPAGTPDSGIASFSHWKAGTCTVKTSRNFYAGVWITKRRIASINLRQQWHWNGRRVYPQRAEIWTSFTKWNDMYNRASWKKQSGYLWHNGHSKGKHWARANGKFHLVWDIPHVAELMHGANVRLEKASSGGWKSFRTPYNYCYH